MSYTADSNMSAEGGVSLSSNDTAVSGSGGSAIDKIQGYLANNNQDDSGTSITGINAKGRVLKANGDPMPGTAKIKKGSKTAVSKQTSGSFIVTAPPPSGVDSGADVTSSPEVDFLFDIELDGIDVLAEGIGQSYDAGTIQYGEIAGSVTDFNGNGVEGVGVSADAGSSATTDANGNYSFNAPGGTNVTLNAVGTSNTKTPSGGQTITLNFQYAGVKVEMTIPTGSGIPNAKATLPAAEGTIKTDSKGTAQFVRAQVNTSDTLELLGGGVTRDITTNGEGQNLSVNVSLGVGLTGKVKDQSTGNEASSVDVKARIADQETVAQSKENGEYVIGATESGEVELLIAEDDRRYLTQRLVEEIQSGGTATNNVELQRQENIGTLG